jgi:hypothetical protein
MLGLIPEAQASGINNKTASKRVLLKVPENQKIVYTVMIGQT